MCLFQKSFEEIVGKFPIHRINCKPPQTKAIESDLPKFPNVI
jgi:hypothetical protein